MTDRTVWETVKAQGGQVIDELRRLLHEGNVRRVVVKQKDHVVAEFPLTVGLVGVIGAPVLASVGALAALLTHCRIEVERTVGARADRGRKPPTRREPARRSATGASRPAARRAKA